MFGAVFAPPMWMKKARRWLGIVPVLAVATQAAPARASVDVYPSAGTRVASPQTQISFRGIALSQLRGVTITGSSSGRHAFKLETHSDGQGASLLPTHPFRAGEMVQVRAPFDLSGSTNRQVRFRVARFVDLPKIYFPDPVGNPHGVQRFRSDAAVRPPQLKVRTNNPATAPGDIFVAPKGGPGQNGPMITDGNGALVWFRALKGADAALDFRTQSYRGQTVLTWWEGRIYSPGEGAGVGMIVDRSYRTIARVRAGNGYQADLHEFDLTPQGTALLLAYQPVRWGGETVTDAVVQEVDVRTGLVEFEWHSLGHVDTSESYFRRTPQGSYDYIHANSIEAEPDGNLLLSGRGTHTVYELDRHTGAVLWRLGGKHSDFKLSPGADFVAQHDARRAPDGTITIFDNGAPPITKRPARAIVLALDTTAKTAVLVRSFTHANPALGSMSQGSVQELPDGHYFVYWGNHSWMTEYDPSGNVLFDAHFSPAAADSYRGYRLAWSSPGRGHPRAAASTKGSATTVWASWNGVTDIASWQVLGGSSRTALAPVTTVGRHGFETTIPVAGKPRFVQVRALAASGAVLGTSAVVTPAAR
jgi:Arylsulfotransferase (ASST)